MVIKQALPNIHYILDNLNWGSQPGWYAPQTPLVVAFQGRRQCIKKEQ